VKNDRIYLQHILDSIKKIEHFVADGQDSFMQEAMIQDAVLRNFEVIGEATKRLSDATKSVRPEIPWRQIAGLRDVLIHDYMGVDLLEVWNVIVDRIPSLREAVESLLDASS